MSRASGQVLCGNETLLRRVLNDFLGLFSIGKIVFWQKRFLGALFTKVICAFLKSVRKDGFFDDPFDLFKEKKFHLL
jgi:hypothetical protein